MEINEIKLVRKKLGITQAELARKANVSQSLIAKIESDRIDPTYSKAKSIFDALDRITTKNSRTARDVMSTKIITVKRSEPLTRAIRLMHMHNISQLPVVEDSILGIVSESSILESVKDGNSIESLKIGDVMCDCAPIIPEHSSIDVIVSLLKHTPIVLVGKYGKLNGVITKADILNSYGKG